MKSNNGVRVRDQIARAIFKCCLAVLATLLTSCSTVKTHSKKINAMLVVVEVVYDGGWRIVGSIQIDRTGAYTWQRQNIWLRQSEPKVFHGLLSSQLSEELNKVANSTEVRLVAGIPTYEYGIDDSPYNRPNAINRLLALLASTHAPAGF